MEALQCSGGVFYPARTVFLYGREKEGMQAPKAVKGKCGQRREPGDLEILQMPCGTSRRLEAARDNCDTWAGCVAQ